MPARLRYCCTSISTVSAVRVAMIRLNQICRAALERNCCSSVPKPAQTVTDGRLTTPISRQATPIEMPVPSALQQASLAAKRLA